MSSAPDSDTSQHTIDSWVDSIFEGLEHPVRNSVLFYTLYYLVEVEGVVEAEFDFFKLRNKLLDAFERYCHLTAAQELSELDMELYIDGTPEHEFNLDPAPLREFVRGLNVDASYTFRVLTSAWQVSAVLPMNRSEADSFLETTEEQWHLVSNPDRFMDTAAVLFDPPGATQASRERLIETGATGWTTRFGGPSWASIIRHCQRRPELPATAWVDQCWSIQHNTDTWLDGIQTTHENEVALEMLPQYQDERIITPAVLTEALDIAQDGRLSTLFDWAEHYNNEVEINLSRWRRIIGI